MEEDENIMFDEMPDMFGRMFIGNTNPSKSESVVSHKTYNSLYDELCDKCFPERFMQPYDANKVSIATKLYEIILQSKSDQDKQKELRLRAYKELGVKFDGTHLYNYLMDYLNPRVYLKPFTPDKLEIANRYYPSIEENKADYIALESIRSDVQWFIDAINEEREAERKEQEEALVTEEKAEYENGKKKKR